ncbi:fatty acid synthase alpha subunit Lsd1, partial [Coemansia erecta]
GRTYQLPLHPQSDGSESLPSIHAWHRVLPRNSNSKEAGNNNWLHSILTSPVIVQDKRFVDNYVSRLLRPRYGRAVTVIDADDDDNDATATNGQVTPLSVKVWNGSAAPTTPEPSHRASSLELSLTLCNGNEIELVLPHRNSSLVLRFLYNGNKTPLAPIHEIMDGRDDRIARFYADIWRHGTDTQTPAIPSPSTTAISSSASKGDCCASPQTYTQRNVPVCRDFSLDKLAIEALPGVFGILTDGCVSTGLLGMVQTEYAVEKCSSSLYASLSQGDELDIVSRVSEMRIVPNAGKQVIAVSDVFTSGTKKKCAEIRATFLFKKAAAPDRCFRNVAEPTATISAIAGDVLKVLESKEWFYYTGSDQRAREGDTLEFHLRSEYTLSPTGAYLHATTKGSVHLVQGLHERPHIADIDYEEGASVGNPVVAFLDSHKQVLTASSEFACTKTLARDIMTVPYTAAQTFASMAGDHNPHNTSEYFADLAGLPGPVMQGLWTCSSVRQLIDLHVAQGDAGRMQSFQAQLTGMVHPGDKLETQLVHVGMRNGRMVVSGHTRNTATGELVLECTALVAQPPTVYVFTGQGSQEPGMGLEWCQRSAVVRSVYDRADKHMRWRFGFSIVDIIRDNPTEYTVYFNSDEAGARIRENYAQFPEISHPSNRSYTFRSPTGLLHATQFAQPAIMLFDVAMAAEMRAQGVFDEGALVAGHSLGEYGALAAFGIMTLEDIIDITFIRGMTMQSIVERDSLGNSDFALVAANPSRVAKGFTEASLGFVIGAIRQASSDSTDKQLLEIVNYNVQGHQYVVAGTRALLEMLGAVLDYIHDKHINVDRPAGRQAVEKEIARLQGTLSGGKELKRGCATIPIPGIDVPFHSSHLLPGAAQFRECIYKMIRETNVDAAAMAGRYIPNLTAATFQVTREYFELMYEVTQSPVISDELSKWPDAAAGGSDGAVILDKKELSRLARLLTIELLSYQFASPVLWIETQNKLFSKLGVKQMVEIGPNSTLCRMAEGSLALLGLDTQVSVLHVLSNEQQVFYQYYNDEEKDAEARVPQPPSLKEEEQQQQQQEPLLSEPDSDTVSGSTTGNSDSPAMDVEVDVPLTALAVVRAIIAQKLRVPINAVVGTQTVRELTGGKSTLQNEILGDLLKEFATGDTKPMDLMAAIPDNPDELTLEQLAQVLGPTFSGSQLSGKHTMMQIARLFSTKMPGAFSQTAFRTALAEGYCPGMHKRHVQDGVLLTAMTMEPATRVDDVPAALAWLQSVVKAFAENANIPFASMLKRSGALARPSSGNGKRHQHMGMENDSAEQRKLAADKMAAYARYLGIDLRQGHRLHEEATGRIEVLQQQVAELHEELGSGFISGIRPQFDKRKVRIFDSYWNWAREDALALVYEEAAASSSSSSDLPDDQTDVIVDPSRVLALENRADDRLIKLVTALSCTGNARARKLACHLRDQCIAAKGKPPVYRETATDHHSFAQYLETISSRSSGGSNSYPPLVHLRSKNESHAWEYCERKSSTYYACLQEAVGAGVSFAGRTVLISGCSKGSIGAKVLQRLLSGGARVIATTSSYQNRETLLFYEALYKQHGARGSELVVVPFNQGSAQDVRALVDYVYSVRGWYLDYVLPFAAMSDYGTDVSSLGSESELSTRVMLTNVLRLLGEVRRRNQQSAYVSRPATLAVLPLSPNHGVFGNDGMYGEAKAALETTFNRWESEAWHPHLAIAGAVIGWTCGTGLMAVNDAVAPAMAINGACTFSSDEMAANVVALMHQRIVDLAQTGPVWADLNGGLQRISDIGRVVADARQAVRDNARLARAIAAGYGTDIAVASGHALAALHADYAVDPLFNPRTFFPDIALWMQQQQQQKHKQQLRLLKGMVNLDKVVVITGYGEVGPYGNAETRWEMEAFGEFSLEGCVELAWIMGLIKHSGGAWVDAQSGMLVEDCQIKARYEQQILKHTGVRLLEPELLDGVDPAVVPIMRELQVDHDLEPFEATADEAAQFKLRNGSKVDVWEHAQGVWHVRFRRGAVLMVPKALRFDRLVGAQLPTGWTPERYGIPREVVQQVDPVTCYALCATAEALVRSGITDPYELYTHFHVSHVGSSLGSGAGGVHAIRALYRNRLTDTHVQSDILQETFANTTVAWINMLLLSAAGVIRPPMGGCATAALSVDVAADTIRCGKARVMVAGGFEGFVDQGSYEFAQMGATGSSADDAAAGRHPAEMSRPCTSTRTGFVEAQGAGVVVLMSASAALECGAPVYGVLAHSASATDRQGVSLPAPGKGIMTSASQSHVGSASSAARADRLLDLEHRREQLAQATRAIDALAAASPAGGGVKADALRRAALDVWGADFWHGIPEISPLRGSLAAWGLTADDIGLASFHGTGTVSNDLNETMVLNRQMEHLGRSPGLAIPVVAQKWLTGHPKGPAGAWMLNSALQSMRTGLIPGNRNADNIDARLQCDYAVFPSRTLRTDKVKACLLKSFGFGQVGAEMLVIHPDYFLATLDAEQLLVYSEKVAARNRAAYRYWQDTFAGNHTLVQVKDSPPYAADQEEGVLLNPLARACYNHETNEYVIKP